MAKICLFCEQEIIQGFSSCAHNWAWREIDDDKFDEVSSALAKRKKGSLKKDEVIFFKGKALNFESAQKEVISGITVYEFEENGITVYENDKKNKIIVFCNDNAFLVDNCQTNVIDILYETDEDGNIKIGKKVDIVPDVKEDVRADTNVDVAPSSTRTTTPYRPRRVFIEEEPTTFKYGDIEIGKSNLVSAVNMHSNEIFASTQSATEFLELLRKNEKLFLPTTDSRYMAKFHTIERELYPCPSLGIFLFCLHSDEATRKGDRYALSPIYDEYYGKIILKEKNLREIRDAYKYRKYWSTEQEKECYDLISFPAVKTLFTDFYLPKVLTYTAISGEDRYILNDPKSGKSPKENFIKYMEF